MKSVGELAAGIAHEINTPIQYIGTNLSFIEEAFADFNKLMEHYQALVQAIARQESSQPYINSIDVCIDEIDLAYLLQEVLRKPFARPMMVSKESASWSWR